MAFTVDEHGLTTREKEFVAELKALLEKYDIKLVQWKDEAKDEESLPTTYLINGDKVGDEDNIFMNFDMIVNEIGCQVIGL